MLPCERQLRQKLAASATELTREPVGPGTGSWQRRPRAPGAPSRRWGRLTGRRPRDRLRSRHPPAGPPKGSPRRARGRHRASSSAPRARPARTTCPSPRPIGISAKAVPIPCSETPGIARIAIPTPAPRKPSTVGTRSPRAVDEACRPAARRHPPAARRRPAPRSRRAPSSRRSSAGTAPPGRRFRSSPRTSAPATSAAAATVAVEDTLPRPPSPTSCTTDGNVAATAQAAASASGTSAHQSARQPNATVSDAAEQWADQVRHAGARAPDPERACRAARAGSR